MNRLYILLLTAGLASLSIFTASAWWLACAAVGIMGFLAFRYFQSRLRSSVISTSALEQEVEELQGQLDRSIRKEQRSSKEAAEYKQVREGLMTALSHEIRTPLNGIMGMASLLNETTLTREQRDYTHAIHKSGENLLSTVNQLLAGSVLNLSKSGQLEEMPPDSKDLGLRDCIEEVLQLFAVQTARSGVELLYTIDREVPEQIKSDRKRLSQILVNLVENAVQHTQKGEVTVSVGLLRLLGSDAMELAFEVRDTGTGMDADKLDQLFRGISAPAGSDDDNKSLAGDDKRVAAGNRPSGLGLIICKRLAESMQGFIEASSITGQGSRFTFGIRVGKSQQEARKHAGRQQRAFTGRQVLVIDGHEARLTALVDRLEWMQMVPVAADSIPHALEILSDNPGIDLLIADSSLPAKQLAQLLTAAKQRKPVISTLGLHGLSNAEEAMSIPFDVRLARPLRQHELTARLLELVSTPAGEPVRADSGPRLEAGLAGDHPLRILVAEDHPVNQKLAMTVLNKLGYQPDMAVNGKQALEMVSHGNYDIILMDVQMPEMDGLEATRMIRRCVEPQPVIIAMTANAMQGDRDSCLQAGMDDYISKPLELDELIGQLKKWSAVIREKLK